MSLQVDHGFNFYEFFAGGGMVRAGLGSGWNCLFANDFDAKKAVAYRDNWGDGELVVDDVRNLKSDLCSGVADLVWGSFPCQDLSLAGVGAGLDGERSGSFWPFFELVRKLRREGRGPSLLVLENVYGTLRSHGGRDFRAISTTLAAEGFLFGAMILNASHWVPQSRPRLFLVAVDASVPLPHSLLSEGASEAWHPLALRQAWRDLPPEAKERWIWWNLPEPSPRTSVFADLIEDEPGDVRWHSPDETSKLLGMMSPIHLQKVEQAKLAKRKMVGAIYKRTRHTQDGVKVQRAEVRFDDVAGCLRTPAGGSSRQVILIVEGESVRSRLISARETARLMGLPDSYRLPANYNEAYHLTGDGVVVPVVRHLAEFLFEPILSNAELSKSKAA